MTEPIRKLAAIVFTDIVGFTKLTAKDQSKASALLKQQRELFRPIVDSYKGMWIKEMGDGLLLTFDTVTDAVNCCIKLQETSKQIDDLDLRIGIHQGEILIEENDVIGDDVNVAARIEPFSAPGGIAISNKVHDAIIRESEFETKYLGKPKLKGVGQEVKVFCITSHDLPETKLSDVSAKLEPEGFQWNVKNAIGVAASVIGLFLIINFLLLRIGFADESEVPSVAILPLDNKGAEEDEFYAYGISADIISDCSGAGLIRVSSLKQIEELGDLNVKEKARKLNVRYISTGTLWRVDNMFQLSIELYDTKESKVVWSDRWQEKWDNLPSIKGSLSDGLLKALDTTSKVERMVETTNTEAYEFYLKGKYKFRKRENMDDIEISRGLLIKAAEMDDNLIIAKGLLGWSYFLTRDIDKALEIINNCLKQAEALENKPSIAGSLMVLGIIYSSKNDMDKAEEHLLRSLQLSKELNDKHDISQAFHILGTVYGRTGDYEKALDYKHRSLKIAQEIDKKIGLGLTLTGIGAIYNEIGDYEKAFDFYTRSIKLNEEFGDKRNLAWSLFKMGEYYLYSDNYEKAVTYLEKALNIRRKLDMEYLSHLIYLYLCYKNLGSGYDEKEIQQLIKEEEYIDYKLYYNLYQVPLTVGLYPTICIAFFH